MAIIRRKKTIDQPKHVRSSRFAGIQTGLQARELLNELGLESTRGGIVRLIHSLGIKYVSKPMNDQMSGYLKKVGDSWEIGVNSLHHPRRQKFTLAHELGHYFLHRDGHSSFEDEVIFPRNQESNPMEWEANNFAAQFLMPKDEFKTLVASGTTSVDDIARHFDVSTMAVRVRAKKLGFRGHGLGE